MTSWRILPLATITVCLINFWSVWGQFSNPDIIDATAGNIRDLVLTDFDNNGLQDICVLIQLPSASGHRVLLYRQITPGQFAQADTLITQSGYPVSISSGFVSPDPYPELGLALLQFPPGFIVLFNTNGAGVTPMVIDSMMLAPHSLFFDDVEEDGDVDLIAGGDIELALFRNNGDGSFSKEIIQSTTEYYDLYIKDINGDARNDLLVGSAVGLQLFLNDGTGNFTEITPVLTNHLVFLVYGDDLDEDGDNDIITLNSGTHELKWYRNDGNGGFTFGHTLSTQAFICRAVTTADYDLDGDVDIFSSFDQSHQFVLIENLGNGIFAPEQVLYQHSALTGPILAGDLDGDGDDDIVWSTPAGIVAVQWNQTIPVGIHSHPKQTNQIGQIRIYPNPARSAISIHSPVDAELNIYDLLGRRVVPAIKLSAGEQQLNLNLPKQTYFLRFTLPGGDVQVRKTILR